jgi:hypothetical protein
MFQVISLPRCPHLIRQFQIWRLFFGASFLKVEEKIKQSATESGISQFAYVAHFTIYKAISPGVVRGRSEPEFDSFRETLEMTRQKKALNQDCQ